MFAALVLAAASNVAPLFFHDFGGNWTCGNAQYHSQWSITSPDGDYWTIVQYGLDPKHPGGTAYVGWLAQENAYVYNDYHNDGSFAQLTAPEPVNGTWIWTGRYYQTGTKAPDMQPYITWKVYDGKIVRTFAKRTPGGKIVPTGNDTCTRR